MLFSQFCGLKMNKFDIITYICFKIIVFKCKIEINMVGLFKHYFGSFNLLMKQDFYLNKHLE